MGSFSFCMKKILGYKGEEVPEIWKDSLSSPADSFQAAAIIARGFCFVKKQTACNFVVFLYRNVLKTEPYKGCRDQKSRRNKMPILMFITVNIEF